MTTANWPWILGGVLFGWFFGRTINWAYRKLRGARAGDGGARLLFNLRRAPARLARQASEERRQLAAAGGGEQVQASVIDGWLTVIGMAPTPSDRFQVESVRPPPGYVGAVSLTIGFRDGSRPAMRMTWHVEADAAGEIGVSRVRELRGPTCDTPRHTAWETATGAPDASPLEDRDPRRRAPPRPAPALGPEHALSIHPETTLIIGRIVTPQEG